jgi:hypothetical protein
MHCTLFTLPSHGPALRQIQSTVSIHNAWPELLRLAALALSYDDAATLRTLRLRE